MAELLLELFSEEIPARMQARAAEDLKRLVCEGLAAADLPHDTAACFVTPRRLALAVDGLPDKQSDMREERRGPRADAPDKAVEGFLRSAGLSRGEAEIRQTEKGAFFFASIERLGRPAPEVIADVVNDVLRRFPWPKSMRWGDGLGPWVRPLQSILCLFDGRIVDGIDFAGLNAGDATYGHRFLHGTDPIVVQNFQDYRNRLKDAHVLIDPADRKRVIAQIMGDLAAEAGLKAPDDPGLLDEVAGLVEWPVPLLGRIDPAYLELPPEVLVTSMRAHQKYFALNDTEDRLAPFFVTVANVTAGDGGKAIVAGNERVLRARLSDARFFWESDRRSPLADRVGALRQQVFQARLGTMLDKANRMQRLGAAIAGYVENAPIDAVERACLLAKADLSTGMVGEFPELQGVMGRYYALGDGEDAAIADAIAEHYAPLGPTEPAPSRPVSVVVALADKIDTLAGFWSIDEKPTGSKDPFALRRAALGVIRIVLENGLRIGLLELFDTAQEILLDTHRKYGEPSLDPMLVQVSSREARPGWRREHHRASFDLLDFFAERLRVHLRGEGVRHDLVAAIFEKGGEDDLVRLIRKTEAVTAFLSTDDGSNLLTAYRRAANILRIEEKKDRISYDEAPSRALLAEAEEHALFDALEDTILAADLALETEDFPAAMGHIARLRQPVDAFFDRVTVNAEDPQIRVNRLRLLKRIQAAADRIADFSRIEV